MRRANHAAGIGTGRERAADDRGVVDHGDRKEPVRAAANPRSDCGYAEHRQHPADEGHGGSGRWRLHQQHHAGGCRSDERCPEQVEPGAAALGRDRAPQQRKQQDPEHRKCDHHAPAEQALDHASGQGAEAADGCGHPGHATEGRTLRGTDEASADEGDTEGGYGGGPGALQDPGHEQRAEVRSQSPGERADGHQGDADDQGKPDADQVGDPAVDRGGDSEHQHVEADRPGAHTGAHVEVGARSPAARWPPRSCPDRPARRAGRPGSGRGARQR